MRKIPFAGIELTSQRVRNDDMIHIKSSTYRNTPRPSGHKKHLLVLSGIKGYKYITSLWYLNGYPDGDINLGSTV